MIEDAVVTAVEDGSGNNKLIAYVTPKYESKHMIDRQELRKHIKGVLPAYMTPSSFLFLDSFPLSPNGKIDRRALPAPVADEVERSITYVAPGTPLEEDVARIFREALGVEDVGIHDDFFALGGHSLLVIQVISRVNEAFQIELPIRALFDSPTVNELVAAIVENQAGQLEDDDLSQLLAEIE
jgi:acyl carrier protein